MADYEMNFRDYIRIINKRKWIIILSVLVILIFSVIFSYKKADIYKATAKIEVMERKTILEELGVKTSIETINTTKEKITSLSVMERVSKSLRTNPEVLKQPDVDAKALTPTYLKNSVTIGVTDRSRVITITATAKNAVEAQAIANTVADEYRLYDLEEKKREATQTRDFINEQFQKISTNLDEAEYDLKQFREDEGVMNLDADVERKLGKLVAFETEKEKLGAEREAIKIRITKIRAETGKGNKVMTSAEISNSPVVMQLRTQITDLEFKLTSFKRDFTDNHPDVIRLRQQIEELKSQMYEEIDKIVGSKLAHLESESMFIKAKEEALGRLVGFYEDEIGRLPDKALEFANRKRKVMLNDELYKLYSQKLEEAKITEAGKVSSIIFFEKATYSSPVSANKKMVNMIIGAVVGLFLGLLLAFVTENLDTSIGTIEDVEKYTGMPVLAVIPHIKFEDKEHKGGRGLTGKREEPGITDAGKELRAGRIIKDHSILVTYYDPKSPVSEAYRTLRTSIEFSGLRKDKKALLISSAGPQEGKSTTLANLAVAFAQAGKKTLIVGCNLRRPMMYKIFNVKREMGLTDILLGSLNWDKALKSPGIPNLRLLTSGSIPPNPSELIASPEMDGLIKELKMVFDVILFDSPPLLAVTDSVVLSSKVDAVIVVYYVGRVAREALMRAKSQIENVNTPILGVVLNDIKAEGEMGYSYYYYKYQYKEDKKPVV